MCEEVKGQISGDGFPYKGEMEASRSDSPLDTSLVGKEKEFCSVLVVYSPQSYAGFNPFIHY